jgi:glycosyltransferase involved in cell wall biosynthesis
MSFKKKYHSQVVLNSNTISEFTRVLMLSNFKGWILEGIVRESAEEVSAKIGIVWIPTSLKNFLDLNVIISFRHFFRKSTNILVINQKTLEHISRSKISRLAFSRKNNFKLYFTHEEVPSLFYDLVSKSNQIKSLVFLNKKDAISFLSRTNSKLKVYISKGGVNRSVYFPVMGQIDLDKQYVLIVGLCKPRKNPKVLRTLIENMKSTKFIIHGDGWENEIGAHPNLQIIPFDIQSNPNLMRNASCYLSLASLEGGPYPTLEALSSGTPVVATDTGWNKDLIIEGKGFVVDFPIELKSVEQHVLECLKLKNIVGNIDLLPSDYSWRNVGEVLFS